MGIFDGAGIHGTDRRRLDRHRRLARLHPHARSRTSRSSTTRCRSARRSTSPRARRQRAISLDRRPPPSPARSREAWWSEWRSTSVPMKTPRSCLRMHRVPHASTRRPCPGSRCQGAAAARRAATTPASIELALGGDLTRGRVDEERAPRRAEDRRAAERRPGARRCALFDADLRRRGAAERTRRAYGTDLGQLALWARAQRPRARATSTTRDLRRYAALLSERGAVAAHGRAQARRAARRSSARCVEHGEVDREPRRPAPRAQAPAHAAARRCAPDEVAALLDRIPASTPLELRDRALFELAYACGLRAEELVDLDVGSIDFDAEQVRVEGKGAKTRFVPAGEPALRAARALPGARPAGARRGPTASPRCSSRRPAGGCRPPTSAAACGCGRATPRLQGGVHPHALRHSFATHLLGGRRGPAGDPGAAGPRLHRTTQVYTRVESARLRAAYARSHPRA